MSNNWAIVVGINQYKFLPNAPLKFSVADALAMQSFLCKEAGFKSDQVLLCGDGRDGTMEATRSTLRDILRHKIQLSKGADNLWFFFSGHGIADHLMTIDGNPQDLKDTAISIHFVTDCLRNCKAKNIVIILDMCRNENHDAEQRSVVSIEASLRSLVKEREGQQGIVTLFSCGHGESSYEIEKLGQGAFTYALLEGLRSQTIVKDLESYLARRVPELHEKAGKIRKQVPLLIPEPGWKYDQPILSHYATEMDVSRLKEMAIDAECDRDFDRAVKLWEQVNLSATKVDDRRRALNRIRDLMSRSATPPPPPDPLPPPIIETKTIDYSKLQELLNEKKWREADQETCDVMGTIIGRNIQVKDLRNYPQDAIKKIDQLWADASDGKFGFLAQARIWKQVNGNESEFDIQVGWKLPSANKQKKYTQLTFNLQDAETGHFPAFFKSWGGGGWSWRGYLLDRTSELLK